MGKSVRVKKGNEVLEIDDTDLPAAAKDGYLPIERIIVANPKTKESFEIAPEDYQHALKDGFNFTDIVRKKVQTAIPTIEPPAQVTPQSLRDLNTLANKPVTQSVATAEDVGAAGPEADQGQYTAKQDFDKGIKEFSAKLEVEPQHVQKAIFDFPQIEDEGQLKYFSDLSKNNPVKYDRIVAADKNRQMIATSGIPGAINAANDYNHLQEQQGHSELIRNIEGQKYIINTALSGEQRTQAHANLEREKSPLINSLSDEIIKDYRASKFNAILSPDQYAGLEELKIFRPEFYDQIVKELEQAEGVEKDTPDINIGYHGAENKKTIEADAPQLLGLEVIKKSLADIGRHNLQSFLQEKAGDLEQSYKNAKTAASSLSDEDRTAIQQEYLHYKKISDELEEDKKRDDERYPRLTAMKLDEAVREQTNNPKFNPLEYGVYRFAKGVENTGESLENLFTGLFAGEDTNTQLAIKRIGEGRLDQNEAFLPTKLRHNDNLFSKATLYSNAGMIGDIASIAAQSAALTTAGAGKLLSTAIPMFTTTQNEFYKQALAEGDANPMAKANVNALIMSAAGMINPDLNIVKRSLGINTVAGKALAGIDEATWKSVIEKNKPLLQKIQNSVKSTATEGAKLGLVYGAGTSIARDIANKELFDDDISGSEMVNRAVQATKDLALSSIGLMGVHAISNFKSVSPQQKGAIWEAGQHPDFAIEAIEDALRKGEIPQTTADVRKQAVKDISGMINKVPTESKKGKPLSDKDRIDYLYNMIVNKKSKKLAEDLPEAQKEDVIHTGLVADYKNNLILEPKTDAQLEARKRRLESDLEPPKVIDGKKEPEKLSDKEKASAKAELEAINDILEQKTKQKEAEKVKQANAETNTKKIQLLFDGNKSTSEILSGVLEHVEDPFLKEQAKYLEPYLKSNPEIKFSRMLTIGRGQAHYTGDWTVLLSHIKDNTHLAKTIIHELYHNISINKLLNDPSFDKFIEDIRNKAIDKLGLKEYLKGAKNIEFGISKDLKYYGLLDNKEFIAELFSNKEFNNIIDKIKDGDKSIFDRFVEKLKNILGIKESSYSEKIKKSILEGIDNKIEFLNDDLIKEMVGGFKKAAKDSDFNYKPINERNAIPIGQPEAMGAHGNGPEGVRGEGESSGMGQGEQRSEPAGEGPTKESESTGEEKVNNPAPEGPDMTGITHAQMDATAREFGLETYQESPEKIPIWDKQADERFAKDPDAMSKLLNKMRNGIQPDAVEQRMMIKYIADLKAKIRANPSDDLLTQLKRAKDLSNIVGGRDVAKSLRARQGEIPVEEQEVGDFMVTKMEANAVSKLTEEQKESVAQHYDKVSSAKKASDEKIAKLEAENARLKAEQSVKKEVEAQKKTTNKKGARDYNKEIDDVWGDLKKHWDEGKGQLSATVIPYADRLIKIAPDVIKLMKIYVEKGVTELGDIVKNIHERAKQVIPEVTEKDIHDIIAGEYKTPRPTRNALMAKVKDLRDEAELINRLEKLENGEVPKNEKSKVKRNQKIEELRKQIKEHDETKLAAHKANLERQRKKLEEKIQKGDFEPETPKEPLKLDKEALDLRDKYLKAKEDWDIEIMKDEYRKRGAWDKAGRFGSEILNVGRVAKSSFDVSMPFRQGLWGVSRQLLTLPIGENKGFQTQKQLATQFGKMYRALASDKVSRRIMADIKESPRYEIAQEAGLDIADPNSRLAEARLDTYGPSLVERIPFIGKPISIGKGRKVGGLTKASERNATVFVNSMKWDIFNNFVDLFEKQGKTFGNAKELYEYAATYANQAIGAGKMPEAIQKANQVTSKFFFSLKLQASRLQLLTNFANPRFYAKVPKEIRNAYLKDMVKFIAMGTAVMGIAHAAGLSVGVNPVASDFGKIKVGDTTYDVWGGFSQWAVLLSRLMSGKSATVGGQTKKLGEANGPKNRGELLLKFARSKASPEAGVAYNLLTGKDYNNKKTDLGKEAVGFITPLLAQDIVQVSQDASVQQSVITAILASHGIGVQTYKPQTEEEKNKEKSEEKIGKWIEKLNLGEDAKKYTPSMIEFEPSKPKPTDEQAKELNESISNTQQELFKKVQGELDWDNMTDKQKQVAIETIIKEGADIGKTAFEAKYPGLTPKRPEVTDAQRQKEREQSEKEREIQRKIAAKARELSGSK